MTKEGRSITLDKDVNDGIQKEAEKQRLNFSTLANRIFNDYLMALKKPKKGREK